MWQERDVLDHIFVRKLVPVFSEYNHPADNVPYREETDAEFSKRIKSELEKGTNA
jgi:hypothetical protein